MWVVISGLWLVLFLFFVIPAFLRHPGVSSPAKIESSYRRKPVSPRYCLRLIHNSDPAPTPNYLGGCYPPPLLWKRRGWNRDKADRDPDFHRGDDSQPTNHKSHTNTHPGLHAIPTYRPANPF